MRKMKVKKRLIFIVIIFIMMSFIGGTFVDAASITNGWISPDDYKPGDMKDADKVKDIGNVIIGVLQFVGSFVSVITLVILGVKYMMGSVEEKAEYKKTMWPYILGAIMIFGITNILPIVSSVVSGIFG